MLFLLYAFLQISVYADPEASAENLVILEKAAVQNAKQGQCAKTIESLLPQSDRVSPPSFQILARCLDIHKKHNDLYRILKSRSPTFKEDGKLLVTFANAIVKKSKIETDLIKQNQLNTEAIQVYRQAISVESSNISYYEALLTVLQENNSKYEARELLNEMISKFGEKPKYLAGLCYREAQDGFLVQARESCQKAIDKDPKDEKSRLAMVQVLLDQKEEVEALKLLDNTALRFTSNADVQFYAGQVYLKKNDYVVAKRYFQKAVALAPNKAMIHLLLGKVQIKLKEDQEALNHLIKACRLDSNTQNDFQLLSSEVRQRSSPLAERFSSSSASCSATKSPASL